MVCKSSRLMALNALQKISEKGAYSHLVLKEILSQKEISEKDKNFITELTYGVLEYQLRLDWIIKQFTKGKRIQSIIKNILRLGVYQILFLDGVPDSAACNESVILAKEVRKSALSGFVNGVLRNVVRNKTSIKFPDKAEDPSLYLSVFYSYPQWIVKEWINEYGVGFTENMLAYKKERKGISIRPNLKNQTIEQWEGLLAEHKMPYKKGCWSALAYYVEDLGDISHNVWYEKGLFSVQGESSMLVSEIIEPQKHWAIMDACSAPGGKAAYLAEMMEDKGYLLACDVHEHRVNLIKRNAERLHIRSITPRVHEATVFNEDWTEKFDVVLIDAPCSGLGVIDKKPDIKYHKTPQDIDQLSKIQYNIITTCSHYVKSGGYLIYSTCTISRKENQEVVNAFLKHNPNFRIDNIKKYLPGNFSEERLKSGYLQLFPHLDGVDGFFVCKFIKN